MTRPRNPEAVVIDSNRGSEEQYSSAGFLCRFDELQVLPVDGGRSVASTQIAGLAVYLA
jgi:hypothetical protein